ncbi:hypothetical protein GCM10011247_29260 [Pseudomonas plecoglossicida]|nr:hypothetical protein GCM10011247_29260 [Pseudomonas plecoglossicida]
MAGPAFIALEWCYPYIHLRFVHMTTLPPRSAAASHFQAQSAHPFGKPLHALPGLCLRGRAKAQQQPGRQVTL